MIYKKQIDQERACAREIVNEKLSTHSRQAAEFNALLPILISRIHSNFKEDKFPQARALYLYMFAHAGKKLNFMGNENGQLREWDEKREQDWNILSYPIHERFRYFMKELNYLYLSVPALYEKDYERAGFEWIDCRDYNVKLKYYMTAKILIDSDWECFGGTSRDVKNNELKITKGTLKLDMERFSGKLFLLS